MEENLGKETFVFDTSALISLGVADLIEEVLKIAEVVTSYSVIEELSEFAKYDDVFGRASKEILNFKDRFVLEKVVVENTIEYIQKTDNEIYAIAKERSLVLISDDIKLYRHVVDKIDVQFSTYFLIALVVAGRLSKEKAFEVLDGLRAVRGWKENIIFLI